MIPHDKITIIRNRQRARELRIFREHVETYFEREYVADDLPMDWEGVRAARSQINRMLPRVIDVVHAAGLDAPNGDTDSPRRTVVNVDVLHNIFSARYADGGDQEILDVIDMAIGVYDAGRFNAWVRTVNPFHYALTAVAFVARLPRRGLAAIGRRLKRSRAPRIGPEDVARLQAVASRLADTEASIEMRFGEMHERQAQQFAEQAGQLADLAERLDFTERVLAQPRPVHRLESPNENGVTTPV